MENLKNYLNQLEISLKENQGNISFAKDLLTEAQNCLNTGFSISDKKVWFDYLQITRKPLFLKSLETTENRNKWAETTYNIIQKTGYSLHDMMKQRVDEHPRKILFKDLAGNISTSLSYEQIYRHIREIAALFHNTENSPRVAIFSENRIESACTDLACLMFDIFDTPISTHFNKEIISYIIKELKINIVITDSSERFKKLAEIAESGLRFKIFTIVPNIHQKTQAAFLQEECMKLDLAEIDRILENRIKKPINQVATTMFTSGSTGLPKGVSFSIYNLVTKRFARAAAVPDVGNNETMLCYLPLFHTFGRYLEMLGSIYWSATYVFAGNPSTETLLALFPKIKPSIFISIPLRWTELYEKCLDETENIDNDELRKSVIRSVVGENLHWGLSAAGYLDPKVFRFFQNNGVDLCSGFGMTEATGGITMTPPKCYKDFSTGIPLPGVYTRLRESGEMELRGHYIARYLEDAPPEAIIPFPVSDDEDLWLPTGDIFNIAQDGYYEIVDRVKDIYKNNKGQTIAPRVVEQKFENVPGIKRTFLVGDGKPYNVLLIVPDYDDTVLANSTPENQKEYFHLIVMAANKDIAPYERVINFSVLERDFLPEKNEVTPKGSLNRKNIEANFADLIKNLYINNQTIISFADYQIQIPRWFFRDLGILEDDIFPTSNGLFNRRTNILLPISKGPEDSLIIGDLGYYLPAGLLDLGIFARQPRLWIGNPSLIQFCPVKEGWDLSLGKIEERIYLPDSSINKYPNTEQPAIKGLREQRLSEINNLICKSLFGNDEESLATTLKIGDIFKNFEIRLSETLRRRLESLARHNSEQVRVQAYRILLLDDPNPDYSKSFPTFLQSGKTFLTEESIKQIAHSNLGKLHLQSLRQRLYAYRTGLKWPADEKTRLQFESVLNLLYNFCLQHPEYYSSIRSELASWILHVDDEEISEFAKNLFVAMAENFDKHIGLTTPDFPQNEWLKRLVFENVIPEKEVKRLTSLLLSTHFLQQSVKLTFNDHDFNLMEVMPRGLWITRLQGAQNFKHYRLTVNTINGKHYDLHMVISDTETNTRSELFYWLAAISGYPHDIPVLPVLGCSLPFKGVLSTIYVGGLSLWDKVREFADIHKSAGRLDKPNAWRKLFTKAFSVFFKAWQQSGYKIVPGIITPNNIVIPEMDFRENATIISLTGWSYYKNTLSLVKPMVEEFYQKTSALYPWSKKDLDPVWIFDGLIEGIGIEKTREFLYQLINDLKNESIFCFDKLSLADLANNYLNTIEQKYHLPLSLHNAIDRFNDWVRMNPLATPQAMEQTIVELHELYKLHLYPELVRYWLYRYTYFANSQPEVRNAFDLLLDKMLENMDVLPIQLIELSDLQSSLTLQEDKTVFGRMVFPRLQFEQKVDIMKIGEKKHEQVIVRSELKDKHGNIYNFREPLEPSEVGLLYQLFFKENYPKEISRHDRHFVITDQTDRVIGGLCYRILDDDIVLLDGTAITSSLQGRGLGSAMINDFFTRMAGFGVKVIKAHFLFGNYYLKHNFKVDNKWGALVKFL